MLWAFVDNYDGRNETSLWDAVYSDWAFAGHPGTKAHWLMVDSSVRSMSPDETADETQNMWFVNRQANHYPILVTNMHNTTAAWSSFR